MYNPAWRPAQLHTERLASIKHHFIDERPEDHKADKPEYIHTLPVHLAIATGHPSDALQPQYFMDALTRQLNIQTFAVENNIGWHVEAISRGCGAVDVEQRFILVFATANLEGVRMAYTGIKRLSTATSPQFGVLFSGSHDPDLVRRCQERLAAGAERFLGIHLHVLGHISAPGPEFSADLARLAGEVQRLWVTYSLHNQLEVAHI